MQDNRSQPWWRFGLVWLVIAGPAVVVIASFVTLYLAITIPDPVIHDYYRKGIEINHTLDAHPASLAPAEDQAHAGGAPVSPVATRH